MALRPMRGKIIPMPNGHQTLFDTGYGRNEAAIATHVIIDNVTLCGKKADGWNRMQAQTARYVIDYAHSCGRCVSIMKRSL